MLNAFSEVAKGTRKACWYFSDKYVDLYQANLTKFFCNFTGKINLKLAGSEA